MESTQLATTLPATSVTGLKQPDRFRLVTHAEQRGAGGEGPPALWREGHLDDCGHSDLTSRIHPRRLDRPLEAHRPLREPSRGVADRVVSRNGVEPSRGRWKRGRRTISLRFAATNADLLQRKEATQCHFQQF